MIRLYLFRYSSRPFEFALCLYSEQCHLLLRDKCFYSSSFSTFWSANLDMELVRELFLLCFRITKGCIWLSGEGLHQVLF